MSTLIGNNQGAYGLFVGRPGQDPRSVAPSSDALQFSSEWGQLLNFWAVIGGISLNQNFSWPDLGYIPIVRFEQVDDSFSPAYTYQYPTYFRSTAFVNGANQDVFSWSRFMVVFQSSNTAQIQKRDATNDTGSVAGSFRALVFNLPADR